MSETKEDQNKTGLHSNTKSFSGAEKTNLFLMGAAVVQIILLAVIAVQLSGFNSGLTGGTVAAPSPSLGVPSGNAPSAPSVDLKTIADDDAVKGNKNAPVTIVEFSDYQCPFCQKFYLDAEKQIDDRYIKTGKVKFVYRDFPLSFHPNAQPAAEAAECAGEQSKYWEMHDLLFEQGVQGGAASFKQYAQQLGLNTAKFNDCLDSGKMRIEVQKDFVDGQRAGVQGTPAFFVNGQEISGAQPFQVFQQVIEAELAK